MKKTSNLISSKWHLLEKGIITRSTILEILFTITKNILVKTVQADFRCPLARNRFQKTPIHEYIHDQVFTASFVPGYQ